MKNIFVGILLCLGITITLSAKPVGRKKAYQLAHKFVELEQESFRAEESYSEFYIFNAKAKKGFVIVSGEDSLSPILAYSDEGSLDEAHLPIQLKALLEKYRDKVQRIQQGEVIDRARGIYFITKPSPVVDPLVKTKWGQGEPFNNLAPAIKDGIKAPIGCVATATAQIMNFYQWPKKGSGSMSYTSRIHKLELSANFGKSAYTWSSMLDKYSWIRGGMNFNKRVNQYSEEEAEAVAQLMYDVAVSCEMDFDPYASATSTYNSSQAMEKYFSYSAILLERNACTGKEFRGMIKRELDAKHPLILTGSSKDTGHAWVVDGYDDNNYLHCNWGWDGIADGYFDLDVMVPVEVGTGGGSGRFNDDQTLVVAIPNKKEGDSKLKKDIRLSFFETGGLEYYSLKVGPKHLVSVKMSYFGNFSVGKFNGSVGVGLFDLKGNFIKAASVTKLPSNGLATGEHFREVNDLFQLDLQDVPNGTYLLKGISKYRNADWQTMMKSNSIRIVVKGDVVSYDTDDSKNAFAIYEKPELLAPAYVGGETGFNLRIENLSVKKSEAKLLMYLEDVDTGSKIKFNLKDCKFNSLDHKDIKVIFGLRNVPQGTYKVTFDLLCKIYSASGDTYTEKAIKVDQQRLKEDLLLDVYDRSEVPFLECNKLTLIRDGEELSSYHIRPKDVEGRMYKLDIFVANSSEETYQGRLHYRLVGVTDGSVIELGESRDMAIEHSTYTMGVHLVKDFVLKPNALKDQKYVVHILLEKNGLLYDVWNKALDRCVLLMDGFEKLETTALEQVGRSQAVYPNPCRDMVYVNEQASDYQLYGLDGRIVAKGSFAEFSSKKIDVNALPKGTYVLVLRSEQLVQKIKLIKE